MAVAFLNKGTMVQGSTSPTSDLFSVTASGANRCAFAVIAYDHAAGMSVTGVTYGGQAMTSCGAASFNPTSTDYAQVWYLVNPPTGSNTLAITVAGTITDIYRNLVAFTGVNQTTPVRAGTYFNHTTAQAYDGAGHYSLVVTSNVNDLTLTCTNGDGNVIVGTNQTSDGANTAGVENAASDHATTAAASVTHTWTNTALGNLAIVGFSINGDPASLTFYANNPIQGGSNAGLLTTVAPTASTSTTGWTVGTTGSANYSRMTYNLEVSAGNFTSAAQPSGTPVNSGEDCFRLSGVTTGQFSAGTWYSSLSVIAVSSGGVQDGRARFRLYRSANADLTGATELTQGAMIGSQTTGLDTSVAQSSSASTQIAASNLTAEFLIMQVAWEPL